MIQAGTTLPRDTATFSPTTKSLPAAGCLPPDVRRIQSLPQFCQPRTKFSPPLWNVFCSTSGLEAAKFDGARTSSICRTENSTIASFCFATPRTPVVALCHHCSACRNDCASRLKGGISHSGRANRRSRADGLISDQGPCCGEKKCGAASKRRFPSRTACCEISSCRCGDAARWESQSV